jgi:hypothetical protein
MDREQQDIGRDKGGMKDEGGDEVTQRNPSQGGDKQPR